MKILTVIPLKKINFKEDLTYFSSKDIKNGSIVNISVRNKKTLGLVVSSSTVTEEKSEIKKMSFKLKKIIEVKKKSIFSDKFLESALIMSDYFLTNKTKIFSILIPEIFREKYNELEKFLNEEKKEKLEQEIVSEKLLFQAEFEDRISYYKTLIRGNFALKKSVFIVLPTEHDINIFYESLSKGIENFTFTMHSGIKSSKIIENYEKIMDTSHAKLILGTAQFLSIPFNDLGVIVLEKESSNIYNTIAKPYLDLRIFVEIYANKTKTKLILSDTLLRFETIERKELERLNEVYPMSFRVNLREKNIQIIDPNDKEKEENKIFTIFSKEGLQEIKNSIEHGKNVFVFSLRKGLATFTVCRDCGDKINCDECLTPLTLYLSKNGNKRMFVCNKCNTEKDPETKCPNCGSWNLIPLGIGTDRVFEEIKKYFSNENDLSNNLKTKIFKLDKESVKNAKEAEKIIKEFEEEHGAILVGTEMAFFYLKNKVHMSLIASFDSLWSIPNFRMSEKIIHLLLSIIELTEKKIIIQTKNKNDNILLSLKSENLLHFIRDELKERKNFNYPPFKRFIKISYTGEKEQTIKVKEKIIEILKEYNPEIFTGFVPKIKGYYTINALLRINTNDWNLSEINRNSCLDSKLKEKLSLISDIFDIYIDPEDLM